MNKKEKSKRLERLVRDNDKEWAVSKILALFKKIVKDAKPKDWPHENPILTEGYNLGRDTYEIFLLEEIEKYG